MEEKNYFFTPPTLILLFIGLIALFGFAFLAFEGGRIYVERQQLKNYAAETASAFCADDTAVSERVFADRDGYGHVALANNITVNRPPISGVYAGNKEYVEVNVSGFISGGLVDFASGDDVLVTSQAVVYCGMAASELSLADGSR
jgi:hypothetical protein